MVHLSATHTVYFVLYSSDSIQLLHSNYLSDHNFNDLSHWPFLHLNKHFCMKSTRNGENRPNIFNKSYKIVQEFSISLHIFIVKKITRWFYLSFSFLKFKWPSDESLLNGDRKRYIHPYFYWCSFKDWVRCWNFNILNI